MKVRHVSTADVVRMASHITRISVDDLRSPCRKPAIARTRFAVFYVVKELYPSRSLPQIAAQTGGWDHSSVVHGIKRAKELEERDDYFRGLVSSLREMVIGKPREVDPNAPIRPTAETLARLPKKREHEDAGFKDQRLRHRGSMLLIDAIRQARAAA
jgi:Bacterial dnaA protein helix-turn-helix